MKAILEPWHILMLAFASMDVTSGQQEIIKYLKAENRVLKEQLKGKGGRVRYTDAQRRLLASKAKELGRSALRKLDTIVSPDTLLRWYRQLIAAKYDGSQNRRMGRPRLPPRSRSSSSRWLVRILDGATHEFEARCGTSVTMPREQRSPMF